MLDDRNIDLVQEGIDVGLRMGELPDSSLTARKIATSRRIAVATPKYLARAGEPKAPGDLVAHENVIYSVGGGGAVWTFKRGDAAVRVTVHGRLHVSAAEGVRAAVLADGGIAIASEWMFSPELRNGAVKTVLDDWGLPPMDLWAVFPTGRAATTKARTFVSFVEEVMRGQVAPTP